MSEATDRPFDDDAWADACAEDLAAEQERRRARTQGASGGGTGTAAEELFKLFGAVADKVAELNNPLLGAAAQGAVRQFVNQAKSAAKPVIERNPEVFDHLAAAGSELLAAYRSAVAGHERRWTGGGPAGSGGAAGPEPRSGPDGPASGDARDPRDDDGGPGPSERIDLD
ncbi:DUF5304 domain-containing protein [Streptomyces sp. WAC06614]|uniref:DUF5304 domain-containing protein n=1 Tax=Streptomyces sp. WAC06614 TaxID=2487416 RepID=UPI000F783A21|nr:DUF5304 domain-containing protein [Streptomyces sp. WAC06614]RSS83432.1 hypothetical protein EF918_03545 [Streptomyces sp. WAC06614]